MERILFIDFIFFIFLASCFLALSMDMKQCYATYCRNYDDVQSLLEKVSLFDDDHDHDHDHDHDDIHDVMIIMIIIIIFISSSKKNLLSS